MKEFEIILEECIEELRAGASVDECLARYPEYAAQLRPLLNAVRRAERGREVVPSGAFKARTRAQLNEHMRTRPRQKRGRLSFWRLMAGAVAVMLAFVMTGTGFAQGALPGDRLYDWKLTSESVWRAVSPDNLGADINASNRRVREIVAVSGDEARVVRALEGYKVLLVRFEAQQDGLSRERILPVLQSHRDTLAQAGLLIPELDNSIILVDGYINSEAQPGSGLSEPTPTDTPPSH